MRHPSTILAGLCLIMVLLAVVPVSHRGQTCVYCHLKRDDTTCLGLTSSTYRGNECSRSYPTLFEPTHDHLWERGTCRSQFSLLGLPLSVACTNGRPILKLSAATQLGVYQHLNDPLAAKPLFASLRRETRIQDLSSSSLERRVVVALGAWEAAGWPGRWDEWWLHWAEPGRMRRE